MGQAKSSKMNNSSEKSGNVPPANYGASAPPVQHGAPPAYSYAGAPPPSGYAGAPPLPGGQQDLPPAYSTAPNNSLVGSAGMPKGRKNDLEVTTKYQPSGSGATRSPPAMPHLAK